MNLKLNHEIKVKKLQEKVRSHSSKNSPLSWSSRKGHSNITRAKGYKSGSSSLDLSEMDQILSIDPAKKTIHLEPRVTMEALVEALLPYRLMVPVIPEFKGITVGGAIMGAGAESSSFKWGCFHDNCLSYEILTGDGTIIHASSEENGDLFYGFAGSYGTFGLLLSAELKLIPIQDFVLVKSHPFNNVPEALQFLQKRTESSSPPDFLDGIIFSDNLACIMEGYFQTQPSLPYFSLKNRSSKWFAQHIQEIARSGKMHEETLATEEYLFRYDLGVFWMAGYLLHLPLMLRFITQGYYKILPDRSVFTPSEVNRFHKLRFPGLIKRILSHPFMHSPHLWKLLHHAEEWVRTRTIIQDFCIPEKNAISFFENIKNDPAIYPLWLCPIKGTRTPQIFAPHLLSEASPLFINFGIYGIPSQPLPTHSVLKSLEQLVRKNNGRKIFYSHSTYTESEFWEIYARPLYETLRQKYHAEGIWHPITEKVL